MSICFSRGGGEVKHYNLKKEPYTLDDDANIIVQPFRTVIEVLLLSLSPHFCGFLLLSWRILLLAEDSEGLFKQKRPNNVAKTREKRLMLRMENGTTHNRVEKLVFNSILLKFARYHVPLLS